MRITKDGLLKSIRSDMRDFLRCVDRNGQYKDHANSYGCSSDVCYAIGDSAKQIIKSIDAAIRAHRPKKGKRGVGA